MGRDFLLLALVFGPLLAALAVPWLGRHAESLRDGWVVLVTGACLLGTVLLATRVLSAGRLEAGLPLLAGRLEFVTDAFGALFALFSAFVWFCATLYSLPYMKTLHARDRYHAVSLVVLSAMLGVVLAGDLLTLFLFFEILGLVSFLLVVHVGTPAAHRAAIQYFWMTLLGGVALLAGIMIVYAMGGGSLVTPTPLGEGPRGVAAALLVLGFGVKAGMVPVHFWLPNAHPVAPSPASALLSGVMIKAGAYGVFRSLSMLFATPSGTGYGDSAWAFATHFGLAVIWLGIVTMAVGVVLALGQSNAKRMLAYHSISQMGFILAGLGAGAYLLGDGSIGTAGGLLHTVNHALFKATLFLGVGAVAFRTGKLDMYALGGLWRRMPVTFGLMLVAAAGITGLPLFNGFASKSMIHHALEAAGAASGTASLRIAEGVFFLTAAGTAASFIKLIGLAFLGRSKLATPETVREAPPAMLLAMGLLCVPIILLGWQPGLLLEGLVAPGLVSAGVPADSIGHYLEHDFLAAEDIAMSLLVFALGGTIVFVGMRFGLFHLQVPPWLKAETGFRLAGRGLMAVIGQGAAARLATREPAGELFLAVLRGISSAYEQVRHRIAWSLRAARRRTLLGLGEAGHAKRRLVESLLVGRPGSPVQAFLEAAWGAIERERHATVRAALAAARNARPGRGLDDESREARVEAVRALAGLMAGAVFESRLEQLGERARLGGVDAARTAFASLHREFGATRHAVSQATAELADARSRGEDIVRAVSARLAPVIEREARAIAAGTASVHGPSWGAMLAPEPARRARRRRDALGAWLRDMARLAIAELRQHPSTWPQSEALDARPPVVSTRRGIQRYARDVALNVAAIFLLLALFFVVL